MNDYCAANLRALREGEHPAILRPACYRNDDSPGPAGTRQTFYDGYVVNAIMDACYTSASSRRWEAVDLDWRGGATARISREAETYDGHIVIKSEILPDGRRKLILKDTDTGEFVDRVVAVT
jgi:hypothetical protein